MLVPLIEAGEKELAQPFLAKYLQPFKNKKIEALVLGCTHYPILKSEIKKLLPKNTKIISQDEIVPKSLKAYLARHPEIEKKLSKKSTIKIFVTDKTPQIEKLVKKWF
jgi:glutamate racemase